MSLTPMIEVAQRAKPRRVSHLPCQLPCATPGELKGHQPAQNTLPESPSVHNKPSVAEPYPIDAVDPASADLRSAFFFGLLPLNSVLLRLLLHRVKTVPRKIGRSAQSFRRVWFEGRL